MITAGLVFSKQWPVGPGWPAKPVDFRPGKDRRSLECQRPDLETTAS
jgi:hypothetical protein